MSPLHEIDDPARLRTLIAAVQAVGSDLDLPTVLRHIVESAVVLVDARYGALGVLDASGAGLSEFINVGMDPTEVAAIGHLPEGHGILGLLIVEPEPLRLAVLGDHPDSFGFPDHHPPMGSFLGVPIRVRGQVFGNLYLTDKQGADEFSEEDEILAVALAVAAGVAIEKSRLLDRVQELSLVADRERIAADLHDTVIQRLFATGLGLQGAVRAIDDAGAAARVQEAVDALDETIRQIRSTIFALQAPRAAGRGLRDEILTLVTEASASLGFEPGVRFDGLIDHGVDASTRVQLLAVLREALSNVVRHAGASTVTVSVEVTVHELLATVVDDGVGIGTGERPGGNGMASLRHRAEALGGTLELAAGADGRGTSVRWRVSIQSGR
ncbi:MAG: putative signal transduction histidine kinase [Acidimicrobiales bacterium]|nr:putative signal transduction histidine kinase [Acidimicrobiales bacterium]